MKNVLMTICFITAFIHSATAQELTTGIRGDAEAIAEAEAMVETMGGMEIWAQLKSVHFVHEWFPFHRVDSYMENEILDLTGPRSWVEMKSEIFQRVRAYSPENKYWSVYENSGTMYEMISLVGSNQAPDPALFQPPEEFRK